MGEIREEKSGIIETGPSRPCNPCERVCWCLSQRERCLHELHIVVLNFAANSRATTMCSLEIAPIVNTAPLPHPSPLIPRNCFNAPTHLSSNCSGWHADKIMTVLGESMKDVHNRKNPRLKRQRLSLQAIRITPDPSRRSWCAAERNGISG